MPVALVVDTDCGVDDALALLMLRASPEVDLVAVTAVIGTGPVQQVARNVLVTLELDGRTDIPVYVGAERPLLREPRYSPDVHGDNGLGSVALPPVKGAPQAMSAVDFYVNELVRRTEPVTILMLGPLTNLALALAVRPTLRHAIAGVVAMGGAAWVPGNRTPAAESNILRDPEAAAMVLGAGVPVTLVGLDVTTRVSLSSTDLEQLREGSRRERFAGEITRLYAAFYQRSLGLDGILLHDPTAVAYLLRPELFRVAELYLEVDCCGPLTLGKTIADLARPVGRGHRTGVALEVDAEAVGKLVLERLRASQDRPDEEA